MDTGYVGGHMGLGRWSFLVWGMAGEGCWGLVQRFQSRYGHPSSRQAARVLLQLWAAEVMGLSGNEV